VLAGINPTIDYYALAPEIIVVVRGTSRLVLTARRQLAMVGE